ncbi:MAG: helix-turn-helix domain-containing protein [Eubacteriales bacterium]
MDYLQRLKALKEERGLTNAEIAELSDIPMATVTRIFNGSTPNPQFETVARITIALGGSLDMIVGLKDADERQSDSTVEKALAAYAELLKEKDERLRDLKEAKAQERKEKYKLAFVLAVFVAFVLVLLTVDILNGHFGYFIY